MSLAVNGLNSYVDPSVVNAASGSALSGKLDNINASESADELKEVCREFYGARLQRNVQNNWQ